MCTELSQLEVICLGWWIARKGNRPMYKWVIIRKASEQRQMFYWISKEKARTTGNTNCLLWPHQSEHELGNGKRWVIKGPKELSLALHSLCNCPTAKTIFVCFEKYNYIYTLGCNAVKGHTCQSMLTQWAQYL